MNALIIIISIGVTILSIRLFKMACGSMSPLKLNTVSYVFYFQIVTSGLVASVLLAIGALDYHPDMEIVSDSVKLETWIWTMYSLISMPLAMIAFNKFLGVNINESFHKYLNAPVSLSGSTIGNQLVQVCFSLLAISVLIYVFINTKRIPLYTLIVEGDPEQANIDRIVSRREFGGIIYIKNLFGIIVIPVIASSSYILLRKNRNWFNFLIFSINFMVAILMVSHDVQKAPIAFFILGFAILEVFLSKGISLRTMLWFVCLPIGLLLIGYSLTTDHSFGSQIFNFSSAFYGRTFLVGYFTFPLSMELFPEIITQQTYGVGIPSFIINSLNLDAVESARLIKAYVHPDSIANGTGNLYSGFYMGEAWANYGYLGLVIAPAIVGLVIQAVHLYVIKKPKTPLLMAFYALITVKWLVGAGFTNFLYLKLLLWPLFLFFVLNFIVQKLIQFKK